jgi:hypothetical protein
MSHWPIDNYTEFCFLCSWEYKGSYVTENTIDDLFFLCAFNYDIWYNFFCRNSPHSINIFKPIVRTITTAKTTHSCQELIKDLKLLPLHSQYIFSLTLFFIKNKNQYKSNQEIQSINTIHSKNLHPPISSSAVSQRVQGHIILELGFLTIFHLI